MSDANLKAKIIEVLQERGALVAASIAWVIKKKSSATQKQVEDAIADLTVEGYVKQHEDGRRYQLADSGMNPPFGGDAA